tara:strand:- start:525 stop:1001 length:477 start_codon:yes stop_codon:yes gene_type:complete
MSYNINISDYITKRYESEEFNYDNLTVDNLKPTLGIAEEYGYDNLQEFEDSSCFYEWQDGFEPIYNYAHVLQYEPTEGQIELITEHAPNICILYIESIESHVIALSGCGQDMSDEIAYAYMVIDRKVPSSMIPTCRMTLSEHDYSLVLDFCGVEKEVV